MLDIKLIRNDPDLVRDALRRRGEHAEAALDKLLELDRVPPRAARAGGGEAQPAQHGERGDRPGQAGQGGRRPSRSRPCARSARRSRSSRPSSRRSRPPWKRNCCRCPTCPTLRRRPAAKRTRMVMHNWGDAARSSPSPRWTTSTWPPRTTSSTWSAARAPRAAASPTSRATWSSCSSPWCSSPCRSWPPRASGR